MSWKSSEDPSNHVRKPIRPGYLCIPDLTRLQHTRNITKRLACHLDFSTVHLRDHLDHLDHPKHTDQSDQSDHFDWSKENKKIIVDPTLFTLSCCVSYRFLGYISKVLVWWLTIFGVIPMVFPLLANHLWYWCLVLVSRLFIWGAASGIGALSWDRPTHLCSPYQPNNLYNLVPQTHMYTWKYTYSNSLVLSLPTK